MKEKESPKDKMPMRPKDATASKAKPQHAMPAPQQDMHSMSRAPFRAAEHTAAKGTHVDGMGKWASMGSETRKPTKAKDAMAPPNAATGS
jgi:hypothetical protein